MQYSEDPIAVEQSFEVELDRLWEAITELDQMRQWFFENIGAFEPKEGFETRFIVKNEDRIFPHLWKITEVDPLKKIVYNWKYEGYAGDSFVTFELSEREKGSHLKLTHQITERFQQNIPEFHRENCLEGWNWFIKRRLKDYLEVHNRS